MYETTTQQVLDKLDTIIAELRKMRAPSTRVPSRYVLSVLERRAARELWNMRYALTEVERKFIGNVYQNPALTPKQYRWFRNICVEMAVNYE